MRPPSRSASGISRLGSPGDTSHSWWAARVTAVWGAGDADVEHVARPVLVRVARRVDVDHDDVVELEALDLRDVGDVDAGLEVELVAAYAAQRGHLGATQAVEIRVGLLRVARDHGAARGRLARHEVSQRVAEKGD